MGHTHLTAAWAADELDRARALIDDLDRDGALAALAAYRVARDHGCPEPDMYGDGSCMGDRAAETLSDAAGRLPPCATLAARRDAGDGTDVTLAWDRGAVADWYRAGHGSRPTLDAAVEAGTLAGDLLGATADGTRGAPGRWFWRPATAEVTVGRVWVRQSGGLDI